MDAQPVPMTKEYKDKHFCQWTYADLEEGFETGCGEIFCFTADGIKENNFNFCPHCGRIITEYTPITAEEDTARAKAHQAGDGLA